MPTRSANFPAAVPGTRRELVAACRAVCEAPPVGRRISYPDLNTASRRAALPMSVDLHAAIHIVEVRHFYGRLAWACFYAQHHLAERIAQILCLDDEALARLDRDALHRLSEVTPCLVPPTARVPLGARRRR